MSSRGSQVEAPNITAWSSPGKPTFVVRSGLHGPGRGASSSGASPSRAAHGGVGERLKPPVLKTGDPQGSGGSNPSPSVLSRSAAERVRSAAEELFFLFLCLAQRSGDDGPWPLVSGPWSLVLGSRSLARRRSRQWHAPGPAAIARAQRGPRRSARRTASRMRSRTRLGIVDPKALLTLPGEPKSDRATSSGRN